MIHTSNISVADERGVTDSQLTTKSDTTTSPTDLEHNAVNDIDSIIEQGLYQMGLSADGTSQVYLNLYLKGQNLDDVGFIEGEGLSLYLTILRGEGIPKPFLL